MVANYRCALGCQPSSNVSGYCDALHELYEK